MKKCSKCKLLLPESQYYKDKRKTDGLYCACKLCVSRYNTKWMKDNNYNWINSLSIDKQKIAKQHKAEYHAQLIKTNKEYYNEYAKQYARNHNEYIVLRTCIDCNNLTTNKIRCDDCRLINQFKNKYNHKEVIIARCCIDCNTVMIDTRYRCNKCNRIWNNKQEKIRRDKNKEYHKQRHHIYMSNHRNLYTKYGKRHREKLHDTLILINNPFPREIKVEYHHITNKFSIPIPTIIHKKHYHSIEVNQHRKELVPIIEKIYHISLKSLLTGNW